MFRTFFLRLLLASSFLAVSGISAQAGESSDHRITVDGRTRTFVVYTPDTLPQQPAVLLFLHGGLGNAGHTQRYGMNNIADREGFLVVYPEGTPIGRGGLLTRNRLVWNAGDCCAKAAGNNVNDIAYFDVLIDHLTSAYGADPDRIYITGMSNGAMMTYRLACELPGRFAAAVPVAGAMTIDSCPSGADVPLLHIHGEADENVPIEGGEGTKAISGVSYRPLSETIALVTENRACAAPEQETGPAQSRVSRYRCSQGAAVVVQIVPGLEHAWPGGETRLRRSPVPFSASEAVWEFTSQYRRQPQP